MLAGAEAEGLGLGTIMAIVGGTIAFLALAFCVSSCVHAQLSKKKLAMNLAEAEEKLQKALFKINNAGQDRAKESQMIRHKIKLWEEKQEEEKRMKQKMGVLDKDSSYFESIDEAHQMHQSFISEASQPRPQRPGQMAMHESGSPLELKQTAQYQSASKRDPGDPSLSRVLNGRANVISSR